MCDGANEISYAKVDELVCVFCLDYPTLGLAISSELSRSIQDGSYFKLLTNFVENRHYLNVFAT